MLSSTRPLFKFFTSHFICKGQNFQKTTTVNSQGTSCHSLQRQYCYCSTVNLTFGRRQPHINKCLYISILSRDMVKNGYWIFFRWLFWILEMSIQFFSFDLLLGWIILMISQYWTKPWFNWQCSSLSLGHSVANIPLSSSCSFFFSFYIHFIHELGGLPWARSGLSAGTIWVSCWSLFECAMPADSLTVGFLCSLNIWIPEKPSGPGD